MAFSVLFMSCGSEIAKHKDAITDLASKWEGTTSAITEFSKKVSTEQSGIMNLVNSMEIAPDAMKGWNEEVTSQYNGIKASAQNNLKGLTAISSEMDGFISGWKEKGKLMSSLKDGLASGKFEGDIAGTITSLTTAANEATAKMGSWKEKLAGIQSAAAKAKQLFAEFSQNNGLSNLR